jgi:hypothetical protein
MVGAMASTTRARLVSGMRQAEHMAGPDERGAVIACYYALMGYVAGAVHAAAPAPPRP